MRLLHIINNLEKGGAERLLVDSLPHYEAHGFDVSLLTLTGSKGSFHDELNSKLKNKIINLEFKSAYSPLIAVKLRKYLQNYDVVHVHLYPSLVWTFMAAMGKNPKIIYTEHAVIPEKRKSLKHLDKFIFKRLSKVICVSSVVKRSLCEYIELQDENSCVIENGADLAKFKDVKPMCRESFGLSQKDFVSIQVSNFKPEKDQETLIRALALLPEKHKLILVGEGKTQESAIDLVREKKLEDRVLFLGKRDDVAALIAMSDVFVLSSNFEGFGLATLEGMASKKPVIVSDAQGSVNLVGNAGLIFKRKDHSALTQMMSKLENDTVFYSNVAEKCFERSKQFDISKMIRSYISVYNEIAG